MSNNQQKLGSPVDVTAELQDRAAAVLAGHATIGQADDGSVTVAIGVVPASLRAVNLGEGLDILAITQIIAWDLPLDDALRRTILDRAHTLEFGSLMLVDRGETADVLQRYNFPAGELSLEALETMLVMVLSSGVRLRDDLI